MSPLRYRFLPFVVFYIATRVLISRSVAVLSIVSHCRCRFFPSPGVQTRLAGHPSQCRPVASLPVLHQRKRRPCRPRNGRTYQSVSWHPVHVSGKAFHNNINKISLVYIVPVSRSRLIYRFTEQDGTTRISTKNK